jgi:hypothetical protein
MADAGIASIFKTRTNWICPALCPVACKFLKIRILWGCGQFVRTNSICPFVFFSPFGLENLGIWCRNLWDAGKKPMSYDERNYELWGRKLWLIFLTIQDEKTKMRKKVPIVVQKVAFLGTFCTTIGLLANETYYHALSCLRYTLCHSILA